MQGDVCTYSYRTKGLHLDPCIELSDKAEGWFRKKVAERRSGGRPRPLIQRYFLTRFERDIATMLGFNSYPRLNCNIRLGEEELMERQNR